MAIGPGRAGNVSSLLRGILESELNPIFLSTACNLIREGSYNLPVRMTSGECCQWVLDGVRETSSGFSQPLGFDSLTLRAVTRP